MIYCATRLTPSDKFIYNHFFDYYKNELGIHKFFVNFNYKIGGEEEFNIFVDNVLKDYGKDIIYNIGPNNIESSESLNINKIKKLVETHASDKDFILTADSDEFHFIPINCQDTNLFDFDYMNSTTIERFSPDFSTNHSLSKIKNYKQLFKTFNFDLGKFCTPKISLSTKNLFLNGIEVGHHRISNKELEAKSKKYPIPARVNHFKWHKEGVNRMQFWNKLWSNEEYNGWKGSTDKQINTANNINTEGNIFIINEIGADLENEFNFKFDYSLKGNSRSGFKDINIHIVDESYIYSMNNKLYQKFKNLDLWDPFQIFCYKSRSEITFVNKIDLIFFNHFYE